MSLIPRADIGDDIKRKTKLLQKWGLTQAQGVLNKLGAGRFTTVFIYVISFVFVISLKFMTNKPLIVWISIFENLPKGLGVE